MTIFGGFMRAGGAILDPLEYGAPAPAPIDADAEFDREFLMVLDQMYLGNYNGRTTSLWAIKWMDHCRILDHAASGNWPFPWSGRICPRSGRRLRVHFQLLMRMLR